jgi:hypothetical protein
MNKNFNLLNEQLAESGLEMSILGAIAGAVSAGASIFGGISASSEAGKANAAAEKAYEEQQELAEEAAKRQNEYNKKAFEAEKENYYAQREFQYETAVKDWQYRNTIQDYNYLQSVRGYAKSVDNYSDQLGFNRIAAQQAYESEQAVLNDFLTGQAFDKEGQLIESLQAQGTAQTGQAGRIRNKAVQASLAEYGRNMAIMKESLSSTVAQTQRNLKDISIRKYGADLSAKAQLAIKPEALPYAPAPEMGPERIFVEPMKAVPGFTAPPVQQSTTAPLISSFGAAAGTLASINWGGANQPSPGTKGSVNSLFQQFK